MEVGELTVHMSAFWSWAEGYNKVETNKTFYVLFVWWKAKIFGRLAFK